MNNEISENSNAVTGVRKRHLHSKCTNDETSNDNDRINDNNNDDDDDAKTRKKPSKLKAWMEASRPHTLTASTVPVVVGYVLTSTISSVKDQGTLLRIAITFAIFATLIQLGTNVHNDYADFVKGTDTEERGMLEDFDFFKFPVCTMIDHTLYKHIIFIIFK